MTLAATAIAKPEKVFEFEYSTDKHTTSITQDCRKYTAKYVK